MERGQGEEVVRRVQAVSHGSGWSNGIGIVVSEGISKDGVRVERLQGRIVMARLVIQKHMVCVMSIYGPRTGRTKTEEGAQGHTGEDDGNSWAGDHAVCAL